MSWQISSRRLGAWFSWTEDKLWLTGPKKRFCKSSGWQLCSASAWRWRGATGTIIYGEHGRREDSMLFRADLHQPLGHEDEAENLRPLRDNVADDLTPLAF